MKKLFFLLAVFSFPFFTEAQQLQWASKLIKFSSDLGGKQFGIKRILGKPDAFPQTGESPNAWTPKKALDGKEVIVLGFEKEQTVRQVAIFENINSGNTVKIMVSKDGEHFETAWTRRPDYKTPLYQSSFQTDKAYYFGKRRRKVYEKPIDFNPGVENVIFDKAYDGITAVKIEFNFSILPGPKQIDAVGISDSEILIQAKINTLPEFEKLNTTEKVPLNTFENSIVVISDDGKELFFTSAEEPTEQIYFAKKENDIWKNVTKATGLNTDGSYNYVVAVNSDFILKGGELYDKGTNQSGYYFYSPKTFEKQQPLLISAFSNFSDYSNATITKDKQIVILSVESDFSQGGSDLYMAKRKEDGTYGLLQNLGKNINSAADEYSPQLLSDTKTLLFSSDGYSTYGDCDIFVSYRLDDTWKNWSEPINMGSKINSGQFEGAPFYDETNEILYLSKLIDQKLAICSVRLPKSILMKK